MLGGGSVGSELGQASARLGSTVTLVEAGPRLLPREDPDAAELLASALRADGVDVRTGVGVTGFAGSTAERAGEALAEVALAVDQRLRARDLAGSMHAYPTYADGV